MFIVTEENTLNMPQHNCHFMKAPMKLKLIQLKMLENLNPTLDRIPDSKSTFLKNTIIEEQFSKPKYLHQKHKLNSQ